MENSSNCKLLLGDCIDRMKELAENSVDSIVTDSPYGLRFMNKSWDYDVPCVAIWKEALRVLKPGGHLLSFGGTRTYHRMVVNIEDAGFEIRDCIQWLYGSGFPKSLNIKEGEFKGWGTSLKPANEPIAVARKPLDKGLTVAENVLKYGCGAINIDGSRIGYASEADKRLETRGVHIGKAYEHQSGSAFKKEVNMVAEVNHQGRWPANIILDEDAAKALDESTGLKDCVSRFFYVAKASKSERNAGLEDLVKISAPKNGVEKRITVGGSKETALPRANHHPTVKPIKLMQYLINLVTPPQGTVLDPFMGSGTAGVAAKNLNRQFIGIELNEEYFEIAKKRIENV